MGPFAGNVDSIGIKVYEQESAAALTFLSRQPGVDDRRLAVFGHSEGTLLALQLATNHGDRLPALHALGLFEPLGMRYLDLITVQVDVQLSVQVSAGQITKKLESTVEATLNTAVAHLRATGSVAATLPYGLDGTLNAATAKYLYQAHKFDPQKLPAELAARTPVIVSCSNADVQVSCPQVSRLVRGLAQAATATTFVHLVGVDQVLNVDPSRSASNYTKPLAFSRPLQKDITVFVGRSL